MIKIVDSINDIVAIWSEAFGDSSDDILFFVNNIQHAKCLGFYEDGILHSMLYLVDCKINNCKSNYVYAACTFKKYQGSGNMSELLKYCKDNYNDVCLIPANIGLIDYYKKRGLNNIIEVDSICFDESNEIIDYLFEGCELEHPIALQYKGE